MRSQATMHFTVTADQNTLERFSRLMWLLHYASAIGHSSYFGMPLDGDGQDRFYVTEVDKISDAWHGKLKMEYQQAGGGGQLELAFDNCFGFRKLEPKINVEV